MSTAQPHDRDPDRDTDTDPDRTAAGWQPLLERPGYEQWWDGSAWRGRAHREPEPFSAFTPELTRALRPGPNRAAHVARAGIAAILLGFGLQTLVATNTLTLPGVPQITLVVVALVISAVIGIGTAVAASLALRVAPRLGGRAIASLALGVSILLGLAPVLLLVAIGLAGGV
ncbi:MAG: DUF2510 domain-containing protein [Microcella sp.]